MRISDWSSDVCSSDLACRLGMDERRRHFLVVGACPPATPILLASQSALPGRTRRHAPATRATEKPADRTTAVEGKSGSVRVYLGGSRLIKNNTHTVRDDRSYDEHTNQHSYQHL